MKRNSKQFSKQYYQFYSESLFLSLLTVFMTVIIHNIKKLIKWLKDGPDSLLRFWSWDMIILVTVNIYQFKPYQAQDQSTMWQPSWLAWWFQSMSHFHGFSSQKPTGRPLASFNWPLTSFLLKFQFPHFTNEDNNVT